MIFFHYGHSVMKIVLLYHLPLIVSKKVRLEGSRHSSSCSLRKIRNVRISLIVKLNHTPQAPSDRARASQIVTTP